MVFFWGGEKNKVSVQSRDGQYTSVRRERERELVRPDSVKERIAPM